MTNCSTEGHEKVPAVNVLPLADGREAPVCAACEVRRYREMREASVVAKLMAEPEDR